MITFLSFTQNKLQLSFGSDFTSSAELNSLNGHTKKSMITSELRDLRYKQQASVLTNRDSIWESAA